VLALALAALCVPAGAQSLLPAELPPDVVSAVGLPSPEADFARESIEADGYTDVEGLAKGPDGLWHARALRGRMEVQLLVDRFGSVFTR
jgi:hypothetical protein